MTLRLSTRTRDALALELGRKYLGGALIIRTGAQPATPDLPGVGTPLVTIALPVSPWRPPAGGQLRRAGRWYGTAGFGGTAGWWRLVSSNGLHRLDGAVGVSGSGADLILGSLAITEGDVVEVTAFTLTVPMA